MRGYEDIGLKFFSKPETELFYCLLCDGGGGGVVTVLNYLSTILNDLSDFIKKNTVLCMVGGWGGVRA